MSKRQREERDQEPTKKAAEARANAKTVNMDLTVREKGWEVKGEDKAEAISGTFHDKEVGFGRKRSFWLLLEVLSDGSETF